MDHIGFDLGKVNSQLCIITGEGELIERRISTSHDSLTKLLGSRPPAHILIEAATESEWVARHLESLGHKVVVADPNFAPMYATRSRRVKTDKRDARTLAEASRLGAFRPAPSYFRPATSCSRSTSAGVLSGFRISFQRIPLSQTVGRAPDATTTTVKDMSKDHLRVFGSE